MTRDLLNILIDTPKLNAAHAKIKQWILCRFSGALIIGESGVGKAVAINVFPDTVEDRDGDLIHVYKSIVGKHDKDINRIVYEGIGELANLNVGSRTKVNRVLSGLVSFFSDVAMHNRARQVGLFVYGAHKLTLHQLQVYSDLYSRLAAERVALTVIFVANQREFTGLAEDIQSGENEEIHERLFQDAHQMEGIQSEEELRVVLKFFDIPLHQYDVHSSILYTLCPRAEEAHFQLSSMASILWSAWVQNYGDPFGQRSWLMSRFTRTIRIILGDYFPRYWENSPSVLRDISEKALKAAGNAPGLSAVFGE
ncbi:hypothetical protein [Gilvimarinus algae]|uniref:Uncharacterized protein n=1 Tax=Gilvimarinus algae TaxID=3058037 RepID=A0ABT8TE49_9GAMM|nr:hypothetical protein [Gilvimarinus sp. SDUM040014]MDO3382387.1 hypothetical protein [Gilvimarinus sp. SDUM040014]